LDIPKQHMLDMYRRMLLSRKLQTKLLELNRVGDFPGWMHLRTGEEAMPAAASSVLLPDDLVTPSAGYENWACCRGVPLKLFLASSMCRQSPRINEVGNSSLIGGLESRIPLTGVIGDVQCAYTGAALAAKLSGSRRVVLCIFGDGGAERGPVHEAMNLAALWNLPVVYLCMNNQYAISMPFGSSCSVRNIADRAVGYAMPGIVVDGNDVFACYEAVRDCVERAREGRGPSLIEAKTYRLSPHFQETFHEGHEKSEGDHESYRTREEVMEAWEKEPLGRYGKKLLEMGVLTKQEAERYNAETTVEVEEAASYALGLPYPDPEKWLSSMKA